MKNLDEELVIDPERGWSFKDEEALYDFFKKDIEKLEKTFSSFIDDSVTDKKSTLEFTLDGPDEVWERTDFFKDKRPVNVYLKSFGTKIEVAICHCFESEPSFIYTYFSLATPCDLDPFQKGELVQTLEDSQMLRGALEGDSLAEADPLAVGLYKAMLTLRAQDDFLEEDFEDFIKIREESIQEADEIWRAMDSYGNQLVYFIKEYEIEEMEAPFHYVVVTVEDKASESNVLLFSFPTKDKNLLDRYRVGENLQAEEIVQEGSH